MLSVGCCAVIVSENSLHVAIDAAVAAAAGVAVSVAVAFVHNECGFVAAVCTMQWLNSDYAHVCRPVSFQINTHILWPYMQLNQFNRREKWINFTDGFCETFLLFSVRIGNANWFVPMDFSIAIWMFAYDFGHANFFYFICHCCRRRRRCCSLIHLIANDLGGLFCAVACNFSILMECCQFWCGPQ